MLFFLQLLQLLIILDIIGCHVVSNEAVRCLDSTTKARECPYVFSSRSGYRPFITSPNALCKLTFRYNSMLNFIQVSFCCLLFLGLGLESVIGLGFKVRVRSSGSGSIT